MSRVVYIILVSLILFPGFAIAKKQSLQKQIWNHIYKEEFKKALELVGSQLKKKPENLKLLSLMEICQNGLNNTADADKTRKKIISVWEKKYKREFIKNDYPINLASYTRMVVVTPSSLVLAAEYYTPYPVNREKDGYYYHKITIYNRSSKSPAKFFKLEKSTKTDDQYILYLIEADGKNEEIRKYGESKPDIRDEVNTILKKMNLQ